MASAEKTTPTVMMYNRAVASDFDDWEQVHTTPGWGAKDLVPLLKKVRGSHCNSGSTAPIRIFSHRQRPIRLRRARTTCMATPDL